MKHNLFLLDYYLQSYLLKAAELHKLTHVFKNRYVYWNLGGLSSFSHP